MDEPLLSPRPLGRLKTIERPHFPRPRGRLREPRAGHVAAATHAEYPAPRDHGHRARSGRCSGTRNGEARYRGTAIPRARPAHTALLGDRAAAPPDRAETTGGSGLRAAAGSQPHYPHHDGRRLRPRVALSVATSLWLCGPGHSGARCAANGRAVAARTERRGGQWEGAGGGAGGRGTIVDERTEAAEVACVALHRVRRRAGDVAAAT